MKRIVGAIIVAVLCGITIMPLFGRGYFPVHDDTQIERVVEMGKAIREGQFPVRWVADLGYGFGYPIYNFYAPLPYYAGGFLYAAGMDPVAATKAMFAFGAVLPSLAMYLSLVTFIGLEAALISALLFVFSPYHAVQMYVRGAVGEYWTLAFWPIILYGFLSGKTRGVFIGAVGVAGAVLSHTLMGYVTVLLTAFAALIVRMTRARVLMICLGLGLSAFFWLPALFEMDFTNVSGQVSGTAHFGDHFVCPSQLWSSLWGYGGSAPGCIDGMSFMLGKAHILLTVIGIAFLLAHRLKGPIPILGGLMAATGVIFTLPVSRVIWEVLPGFEYLQYPWRFLSVAGFGIALLGGSVVNAVSDYRWRWICTGIILLIVVGLYAKWFKPQYTYERTRADVEADENLTWRASKISDEYLPSGFVRPRSISEVAGDRIFVSDMVRVTKIYRSAVSEEFRAESTVSASIVLRRAFFPGWRYQVNGKSVTPKIDQGLPVITIPSGISYVTMTFTDTAVRLTGNVLSLISVMIMGGLIYAGQRKTKR